LVPILKRRQRRVKSRGILGGAKNFPVQVVAKGFPKHVADVFLSYGHVMGKMTHQQVAIKSLQIRNPAPTVTTECFCRIVFDVPLADGQFPLAFGALGNTAKR